MTKRWRELRAAVERITGQIDQLDRRTEKMEVILMVREPTTSVAAEAYEGLRRQVVTAAGDRMAHLAQLVQLDAALIAGADADSVGRLVGSWVEQASLERVVNPEHPKRDLLFETVEDLGGRHEVLEAAYVDTATGRVVRRGSIRRAEIAAEWPDGQDERRAPWEVAP